MGSSLSLPCLLLSDGYCLLYVFGERKLGRLVDALALGGDEGRDKLR